MCTGVDPKHIGIQTDWETKLWGAKLWMAKLRKTLGPGVGSLASKALEAKLGAGQAVQDLVPWEWEWGRDVHRPLQLQIYRF
jgi:hypothetical protein